MSILNLKLRFARIIDDLSKNRQQYALNMAGDVIALVSDRLTNEGVDANGRKFPLYSENNLGIETALKLIANSNKPGAKLKKGETSYKDIRSVLGLPTDKRTHVFTGDMMKSLDGTVIESNKYLTIVEIKSKDQTNQKKLNENSIRMRVNLLKANDKEKKIIDNSNQERLTKTLNQ